MSDLNDGQDPAGDVVLRSHLNGVAYRLLGSVADSEDAVQDGFTRWYALSRDERQEVRSPSAWLTTVVTRICLDVLRSARVRRAGYVGPWLPEPVAAERLLSSGAQVLDAVRDPSDVVEADESMSIALLVVLERLTPAERVAFVLHDVFGIPFREIGEITGRSPGACRQLASSARRRVHAEGRTRASREDVGRAVVAFKNAWESGDLDALTSLLTHAAAATIDGGGKVSAATAPLIGADTIAAFFLGVHSRQLDLALRMEDINGAPGLVASDSLGTALATVSVSVARHKIHRLWVVRNPDKLGTWNRW